MTLKPDLVTILYVSAIAIVAVWVWRTVGGVASTHEATATIGKSMIAVTG